MDGWSADYKTKNQGLQETPWDSLANEFCFWIELISKQIDVVDLLEYHEIHVCYMYELSGCLRVMDEGTGL